jgi:drug/metabolite transporter (DMT)-like permease
MAQGTNRTRGLIAAAAILIVWSTPALFMHWLTRHYDAYTQNFYRYLAGTLSVLPFALTLRKWRGSVSWRTWLLCAIPAIPNVGHQIAQTESVARILPGFYAVFTRLTVVFTALAAMLMFADERRIIRDPRFIAGALLGIAGAIGIVVFRPGFEAGPANSLGVTLALVAAGTWALYSVLVKKLAGHLNPLVGFSIIGAITTMLLLPLAMINGHLASPLMLGWWPNTVLIFSGVFCIGIGHALFYITIQDLGVAVAQNVQLLCPLGTVLLSACLFDEKLSLAQLSCGIGILAGAFLTISIDRRVAPEED